MRSGAFLEIGQGSWNNSRLVVNCSWTPHELISGSNKLSPIEVQQPDLVDITRDMPRRAAIKIGRNEPCPCGSGKKYKNCCGNNLN